MDAITATPYWKTLAQQASQHPLLTLLGACSVIAVVVLLLAWRDAKGAAWTGMRSPERPWLRIDGEPKLQTNGDVTFVLKNFGQTPAYRVSGEAWFEIAAQPTRPPGTVRQRWWQWRLPKSSQLLPGTGFDFQVEADSRKVKGVSRMHTPPHTVEPGQSCYIPVINNLDRIKQILKLEGGRLVRVRAAVTYTDNTDDLEGISSYCYGHLSEKTADGKIRYKIFRWYDNELSVSQ